MRYNRHIHKDARTLRQRKTTTEVVQKDVETFSVAILNIVGSHGHVLVTKTVTSSAKSAQICSVVGVLRSAKS